MKSLLQDFRYGIRQLRNNRTGFVGSLLTAIPMRICGVMSYVAAQRAPEFGVRVALGSSPRQVILLVLRQAALLAGVGIAVGVLLAVSTGKVISDMLFGLKAFDAATYALVLPALTVFAVLAAVLPAWRASRADPMVALREE